MGGSPPHNRIMENQTAEQQATNVAEQAPQQAEQINKETPEVVEQAPESNQEPTTKEVRDPDFVTARMRKAEEAAKQAREELAALKRKKAVGDEAVSEDYVNELLELRDSGFNKEEITYIRKFADLNKVSMQEASKDPFVLGGVKELREQKKIEAATPTPSSGTKSEAPKPFSQMSKQEREKNYSFQSWKAKKSGANKTV